MSIQSAQEGCSTISPEQIERLRFLQNESTRLQKEIWGYIIFKGDTMVNIVQMEKEDVLNHKLQPYEVIFHTHPKLEYYHVSDLVPPTIEDIKLFISRSTKEGHNTHIIITKILIWIFTVDEAVLDYNDDEIKAILIYYAICLSVFSDGIEQYETVGTTEFLKRILKVVLDQSHGMFAYFTLIKEVTTKSMLVGPNDTTISLREQFGQIVNFYLYYKYDMEIKHVTDKDYDIFLKDINFMIRTLKDKVDTPLFRINVKFFDIKGEIFYRYKTS